MIAALIDTAALAKMLYSSLLAGVGVVVIFSIAVLGVTRSGDMRRANRPGPALAYAALAGVGLLLAAAIVAYGLIVVTSKT